MAKVRVVSPDGRTGTIPQEGLQAALADGFRLETEKEARSRVLKKESGAVSTALMAGADAATFGLGIPLAEIGGHALGALSRGEEPSATPVEKPVSEALAAGREAHSGAALIGDIGGSILGIAGSGVGSVAAKAGGKLAGAATKKLAGRVAAGGLADKVVSGAARMGGAGAVESLATAGTAIAHEAHIGETPITRDYVMATLGTHLLLGVGGGAIVGGGGPVLTAGAKKSARLLSAATRKVMDKGVDAYATLAARTSGTDKETIKKLFRSAIAADDATYNKLTGPIPLTPAEKAAGEAAEKAARTGGINLKVDLVDEARASVAKEEAAIHRAIIEGKEGQIRAARKITKLLDEVENLSGAIEDESKGALKYEHIKRLVKKDNIDEAYEATSETFAHVRDLGQNMVDNPGKYADWGASKGKTILKYVKNAQDEITDAWARGNPAKIFKVADDLKRKIGNKKLTRAGNKVQADVAEAVYTVREDIYETLRGHLQNEQIFGGAGEAQRRLNKRFTDAITAGKNMREHVRSQVQWGRDPNTAWEKGYRHDPEKIRQLLSGLDSTKSDLGEQALRENLAEKIKLTEEFADVLDLGPEDIKNVARLKEASRELLSEVDETGSALRAIGEMEKMRSSPVGGIAGTIGGGVMFGPAGAALGAARGAVTSPGTLIKGVHGARHLIDATGAAAHLHHLAERAASAQQSIIKAVDGFFGMPGRVAGIRAATSRLNPSELRYDQGDDDGGSQSRQERFSRRVDGLASLVGDPDAFAARVSARLAGAETAAPRLTAAMAEKSVEVANWLLNKAPKPPALVSTLQPTVARKKWKPSMAAVAKYERYERAALDPLSVLEDIEKRALSQEGVEALRELWPELHASVQEAFAAKAAQLGEQMPYRDRVQLSLLFGEPLDATMRPEFIAGAQALYAPKPELPPGQAGGGVRATGLSKLTLGTRKRTEAQELADDGED